MEKTEIQQRRRHRIEKYWLVQHHKQIDNQYKRRIGKKVEEYAPILLGKLGFSYILSLNGTMKFFRSDMGRFRKTFPFDYYCERDNEKWFVEITCYIKKDIPQSPLWRKLGVRIGILFVRRDLEEYCFKEASEKSQIILSLKDLRIKYIPHRERALRAWETRRNNQLLLRS